MKRISGFNSVEVCGYVTNFTIKAFPSGTRIANITIANKLTGDATYVQMFDRASIMYGGQAVTLDGLGKIFMDANGKPRDVLITVKGKIRESKVVGGDGATKTYTNITVFSIDPCNHPEKQRNIFKGTGVIDAIKYGEDEDGNVTAKIKLGMLNYNKDKNINGVDFVTVVARGDAADKLETLGADKGCTTELHCDILNQLPETDRFGNRIGAPTKEILVAHVRYVNDADDIDETDVKNYKKAKTLGKGEFIVVKKETSSNSSDSNDDLKDDFDDLDDLD